MKNNFSILVNTTDSFYDCWESFFKLFKQFWPSYDGKIYLNTEKKDFSYKGLGIISVQHGGDGFVKNWSNYLLHTINLIPEEIILYMQEDYFLFDKPDEKKLDNFISLMKKDQITYINLYPYSRWKSSKISYDEDLYYVERDKVGAFSLQASLWNRNKMLNFLSFFPNLTPWEIESKVSLKTNQCKGKMLRLNREKYNWKNAPLSYFIAINKGKWSSEIGRRKELQEFLQKYSINLKGRGYK